MDKIKVAVIGTGNISKEHINGYLKNPNVELYAFCDINADRVKMMSACAPGTASMLPVPSPLLTPAAMSFAKSRWRQARMKRDL